MNIDQLLEFADQAPNALKEELLACLRRHQTLFFNPIPEKVHTSLRVFQDPHVMHATGAWALLLCYAHLDAYHVDAEALMSDDQWLLEAYNDWTKTRSCTDLRLALQSIWDRFDYPNLPFALLLMRVGQAQVRGMHPLEMQMTIECVLGLDGRSVGC